MCLPSVFAVFDSSATNTWAWIGIGSAVSLVMLVIANVNEETKRRRTNPGRAAIFAVGLLAIIYTLAQVGMQGVVSPAKLQANSASALVYVAQALAVASGPR